MAALIRPMTIELLGVARLVAGVGEVEVTYPPEGTTGALVRELAARLPALVGPVIDDEGAGLRDGFVLSVDGRAWTRGPGGPAHGRFARPAPFERRGRLIEDAVRLLSALSPGGPHPRARDGRSARGVAAARRVGWRGAGGGAADAVLSARERIRNTNSALEGSTLLHRWTIRVPPTPNDPLAAMPVGVSAAGATASGPPIEHMLDRRGDGESVEDEVSAERADPLAALPPVVDRDEHGPGAMRVPESLDSLPALEGDVALGDLVMRDGELEHGDHAQESAPSASDLGNWLPQPGGEEFPRPRRARRRSSLDGAVRADEPSRRHPPDGIQALRIDEQQDDLGMSFPHAVLDRGDDRFDFPGR